MSNLQPNCCLKFDCQKVDQHAGGDRLIFNTVIPIPGKDGLYIEIGTSIHSVGQIIIV